MIDEMEAAAEEAAGVLRQLSNPSRLRILCHLSEGECTVGSLMERTGFGQAYVSQQLARMRGEDLVRARRAGREVYYELADPRIAALLTALYGIFCARP